MSFPSPRERARAREAARARARACEVHRAAAARDLVPRRARARDGSVKVVQVAAVARRQERRRERGHNDLWGGGERGDRTGRGIAGKALERAPPPCNPSTSGFTGKPALVLDRPGGIPQGYGLTSRRSVTEPRWVSSPPSYCATAPLSCPGLRFSVEHFLSCILGYESISRAPRGRETRPAGGAAIKRCRRPRIHPTPPRPRRQARQHAPTFTASELI